MELLIDDVRDLKADVIARTYDSGMKMLAIGGWSTIIFDHDLGGEKTGYNLLVHALACDWFQTNPVIEIVTANPVGLGNMREVLNSYGYRETNTDSRIFKRY